ncbi:MAG: hypothetical protein LKI24_14450 [Acidipropionibacterium sp.]|jgi:hypothetical protein|nr:hypothetical protein [Acidipropionibacterium sp.]
MDDIREPHQTEKTPSQAENGATARGSGRTPWRSRLRNVALGIAAAATIAVGGVGMIDAQDAAAAGVSTHNYAVLTQTTQVPAPAAEPKDDD